MSCLIDINQVRRVVLGNVRENDATLLNFNYAEWIEQYGEGTLSLIVKRNGDTLAYPVVLATQDGVATWTVSNVDTAIEGTGEGQFLYHVDEVLKKSLVFEFLVLRSLDNGAEPPEPYESFLEQMTELAGIVVEDTAEVERLAQQVSDDASAAAESKRLAEGYASDAQGYANDAQGYKNDASGYAIEAQRQAGLAQEHASDSQGYANEAKGYRNDASGYAADASGYASYASGYANNAQRYANDASGYAAEAQRQAGLAQGYAEQTQSIAETLGSLSVVDGKLCVTYTV